MPALLPGYIARWSLSATEAGWLVGIFFAAYVVMVPLLVALTDRMPARRVYMLGTGLTALSHLGFALLPMGSGRPSLLRVLAGVGWAGTYMPGLKAITDPLEGTAQSRAVSWHAAGVGISGAASFAVAGLIDHFAGPTAAFLVGSIAALLACADRRTGDAGGLPKTAAQAGAAAAAGFPAGAAQSRGDGMDRRLHGAHLGAGRAAGLGRDFSRRRHRARTARRHGCQARRSCSRSWLWSASSCRSPATRRRSAGVALRVVTTAMSAAAVLSIVTGWSAGLSAPIAALLVLLWNAAIYFDSSALTAGTVQAADKELRGATMGLHSMCGYAGGLIGRSASASRSISPATMCCWAGVSASAIWPPSP